MFSRRVHTTHFCFYGLHLKATLIRYENEAAFRERGSNWIDSVTFMRERETF